MPGRYRDMSFFKSEVLRASAQIEIYQKQGKHLLKEAVNKVTREERSSGGDCLWQGFYYPSKIADIVVSGVNRGKILKRITGRSKPNFRYGFDENNQLVYVESPYNRETVIHTGQTDIGLSFDKYDNKLECYSEAEYDRGRLKIYTQFTYCYPLKKITECHREEYTYAENTMVVDWYEWCPGYKKNSPVLSHEQFIFHVDNGYLKQYTCRQYDDAGNLRNSAAAEYVYDVKKERRV